MDKQKKIVLQIVIPIAIIVISLLFYFLITFMFNEKKNELPSGQINTDIPDVTQKIESNKLKAYDNQRIYERRDKVSEFEMNFMNDTIIPDTKNKDTISETKKDIKTSKIKKKLKKEVKKADQEYRDFIKENKPETITNQAPTPASDSIIIDQSIMFNSQTTRGKNSEYSLKDITGYINNEQVVVNHSLVKLRNAEAFNLKGVKIPANTVFYGNCNLGNGRVLISIRNIPLNNRLIPCNIVVVDIDGHEGIYVPANTEAEAGKKSASTTTRRIGTSLGSTLKAVTGTNLAGELTGLAAEGVIKGISDGASDKIKLQKVILPNNYKLILKIK